LTSMMRFRLRVTWHVTSASLSKSKYLRVEQCLSALMCRGSDL